MIDNAKRVRELERLIDDADLQYYERGTPKVSDAVYDSWIDELRFRDRKNVRLTRIGVFDSKGSWPKYTHTIPMGSQNKVNCYEEMKKWMLANASGPVVGQEKMDGLSLALYYDENGKLEHAVTRGDDDNGDDSVTGEDVTPNVKKIKNVPQQIDVKTSLSFRAEVYLPKSVFEKKFKTEGKKTARNMAAGLLKRLEGTDCEELRARAYTVWGSDETTESGNIELLKKFGFEVVSSILCNTPEEVQALYLKYSDEIRPNLEYEIDGLVLKQNKIDEKDDPKRPKHQIAYKFEAVSGQTELLDIEWLNSGGHITPRAKLKPLVLMGSTVQHASLSNARLVIELGLRRGDIVNVIKANDVIPHLVNVHTQNKKGELFVPPTHCNDCGAELVYEEKIDGTDSAFLECSGYNCPNKAIRAAKKWLAAHNTKEVGGSMIEKLHEQKMFVDLPSFLRINELPDEKLTAIEGFGKSKVKTLKEVIESTKNTTLERLLIGLDIKKVGDGRSELIVKTAFRTFKTPVSFTSLTAVPIGTYASMKGMSEASAKILMKNLRLAEDVVNKLPIRVEPFEIKEGTLTGKSFCFTGGLDTMERSEAIAKVKERGGTVKGGVGKDLDFLVSTKTDSGKALNAAKLGTKVISEQEFLKMIE